MSALPPWFVAALPLLVIVVVVGVLFLAIVASLFPHDEEGPRGGGMVE